MPQGPPQGVTPRAQPVPVFFPLPQPTLLSPGWVRRLGKERLVGVLTPLPASPESLPSAGPRRCPVCIHFALTCGSSRTGRCSPGPVFSGLVVIPLPEAFTLPLGIKCPFASWLERLQKPIIPLLSKSYCYHWCLHSRQLFLPIFNLGDFFLFRDENILYKPTFFPYRYFTLSMFSSH